MRIINLCRFCVFQSAIALGACTNVSEDVPQRAQPTVPALVHTRSVAPSLTASDTKVERLLELTGANGLGEQIYATMAAAPNGAPSGRLADLKTRLDTGELRVKVLAPVAKKYWSEAELDELIRFHESPVGRRHAAAQVAISADMVRLMQRWAGASGEAGALGPLAKPTKADIAAKKLMDQSGVTEQIRASLQLLARTRARGELDVSGLVERIAPIYARHLSEADLEALAAWYDTPVGSRALKILPEMLLDISRESRRWVRAALADPTATSAH